MSYEVPLDSDELVSLGGCETHFCITLDGTRNRSERSIVFVLTGRRVKEEAGSLRAKMMGNVGKLAAGPGICWTPHPLQTPPPPSPPSVSSLPGNQSADQ
ncbi:hypothetical protein EYF80_024022 [Liparis tanakae]|uniref:Uncharacterized protein n=1 Tax=Liparis tanakae TaxID=230148 RepID=A0A4Z2HII7_9TELE|nr:hypothetical protein EYF80_024022 [Liparis tanakae]